MFDKKLDSLMNSVTNEFIKEGLKSSAETVSGEGALKYSTSGDEFVDNFTSISYFKKPRNYVDVAKDMALLWSIDPLNTVKLAIYIRLITRKSQVVDDVDSTKTLKVQKGQGLKNEGIMRMLWLAINQSQTFKANIYLFIAAGSWKDIFTMMSLDLQYHGWNNRKLDWNFLYDVIIAGMVNPDTDDLVLKYLPTIRTNKKCTTLESQADTLIGRWIANKFFDRDKKIYNYKLYRKTKAAGLAHQWQQKISKQLYNEINFNTIAGKALSQLVGSKFLENHNLVDKYKEWIISKPTAKYNGYVHELFQPLGYDGYHTQHIEDYEEFTINAQFKQLVEIGKSDINSNLLVVRDTSGSMMRKAIGCSSSSYAIGKAMALYFSEFLKGPFANTFAEFSDTCVLKQWKGDSPCDKYINDKSTKIGGTNFQSVIDLFIKLKDKGVNESDFPSGILLVSDGEFSFTGTNTTSNFNMAIKRLKEAGFSDEYVENFKIILWDIPNDFYGYRTKSKFEDFSDASNFFYFGGYDPSVITFIMGGNKPEIKAPKNARELFDTAMNQDLLNMVTIIKPRLRTCKKKLHC